MTTSDLENRVMLPLLKISELTQVTMFQIKFDFKPTEVISLSTLVNYPNTFDKLF